MKKVIDILVLSMIAMMCMSFLTCCKGSSGRKVATEAVEFLERKAGSKATSTIEREVGQAERNVVRETEGSSSSRSSRPRRYRHSSYDDNSCDTQVYTVPCSQCGGHGAVYVLDYYGNVQYDYYGNPVVNRCAYCNGTGAVLVTQ